VAVALAAVNPFMPLFLAELGEDQAAVVLWTGALAAVSNIVQIVVLPAWGAIADRLGRKPMVIRGLFGAAAAFGLMALATQAWQLFVLRAFQGAFASPTAPLTALAASLLPSARLSAGMGLLQTSMFLGQSTGPLLGSLVAQAVGFRWAIGSVACALLATGVLVAFLVREPPRRRSLAADRMPLRSRLALGLRVPVWRITLLAMFGYQLAYVVSWILLPIDVADRVGGANAASAIGVVFLANSVGVAAGATLLGWIGGRFGARRVAVLSMIATGVLTLPQAWAFDVSTFAASRFALGLCAGGVLPALRAALGEPSPDSDEGAHLGVLYGLGHSAQAAGVAIGAPIASIVATVWGLPLVYAVSCVVMLAVAGLYARALAALKEPVRKRGLTTGISLH
jgi:DHA1 family multidrug resistance protein-like MFS transporter